MLSNMSYLISYFKLFRQDSNCPLRNAAFAPEKCDSTDLRVTPSRRCRVLDGAARFGRRCWSSSDTFAKSMPRLQTAAKIVEPSLIGLHESPSSRSELGRELHCGHGPLTEVRRGRPRALLTRLQRPQRQARHGTGDRRFDSAPSGRSVPFRRTRHSSRAPLLGRLRDR